MEKEHSELEIEMPREPGEREAEGCPSLGKKVAAGAVAGIFTMSNVLHGAPCGDGKGVASRICEAGYAGRHDPHIEMGGNSSTGGQVRVVQMMALGTSVTAMTTISADWLILPKSS